MLRQLLSGLFRCVNPQVILVSIIIAVNVIIITVLLIIMKVGNWEGGEVEEYNRAITASRCQPIPIPGHLWVEVGVKCSQGKIVSVSQLGAPRALKRYQGQCPAGT